MRNEWWERKQVGFSCRPTLEKGMMECTIPSQAVVRIDKTTNNIQKGTFLIDKSLMDEIFKRTTELGSDDIRIQTMKNIDKMRKLDVRGTERGEEPQRKVSSVW